MKVKVLFGFLLSFLMLNGIESTCNYFQNLEAGQTYYAFNLDFPNKSEGAQQCTWKIESRYVTKINCSVDMPVFVERIQEKKSLYCQDILSIQSEGSMLKFCSTFFGTLDFEGLNPIIKLDSPPSSQGGKLLCQIQDNWLKVCGSGELVFEGINPIIKFDSPSSQGGKFLCQIQEFDENNCKCGWKKVTKIVGGTETGINEYPMMCGLVDSTMGIIYCGCTIISEQYVLTAAHCIENKDWKNETAVLVGEHDVTTGRETNATKLFRISHCTIHPNYNDRSENDIAVCKINGTIKYNAKIGPVCLPFHHKQDQFVNKTVTALGWGLLEFGGAKATTLQKVNLKVIYLEKCKQYYSNLTNKNLCTYTPEKDTCQMDSGGPLLWQDPTTHNFVLAGIISSGIGCASNEPAIATRVGAFIDWIISQTPGEHYCMIE